MKERTNRVCNASASQNRNALLSDLIPETCPLQDLVQCWKTGQCQRPGSRAYAQYRLPNSHKQEQNGNMTWNKVNGKVTHTLCFNRLESLYYTSYYFVNIFIQPPKIFPQMSRIEADAVKSYKWPETPSRWMLLLSWSLQPWVLMWRLRD